MPLADWFLTAAERGNPATVLDADKPAGTAWSTGNTVRPLVHGATYFAELVAAVERMRAGRPADVRGLARRPGRAAARHAGQRGGPRLARAAAPGRAGARAVLALALGPAGLLGRRRTGTWARRSTRPAGCCLLDMRVRTGGSHHQKFVVLRHRDRPELDVAFVGGIDLCHSRRDDAQHAGDPQRQPMAKVYGDRPPWHDVQLAITGPAVADVETVFRERWDDPQPLSRSPIHRIADRRRGDDQTRAPLPARLARAGSDRAARRPAAADVRPPPRAATRSRRDGERSVARGYIKALRQARRLIYIEDQYLWSTDVGRQHRRRPDRATGTCTLIAVLPHHPDQDGRFSEPPNVYGREAAFDRSAGGRPGPGRASTASRTTQGTPVYVHAKVCIIDDVWASTGSDNFNRRSWTHDSELTAAVWDTDRGRRRALRPRPAAAPWPEEHLDGAVAVGRPRVAMFDAFAESSAALQRWYDGGRRGPRPPGQAAPARRPGRAVSGPGWWAEPLYRTVYDPDARRLRDRMRGAY